MSQQQQSFRSIGNTSTNSSANDASINVVNNLFNAIIGVGASTKNTTGTENTILGTNALLSSTGGSRIVAVGAYAAQRINSASGATLIGDRVAPVLLSGYDSVIVGFSAGLNTMSADGSVLIGPNCGTTLSVDSTSGSIIDTVGIGSQTAVSGLGSICVGSASSCSGDGTVCVGYRNAVHGAARGVTIGSHCTNYGVDSIVIGSGVDAGMSNSLIIVAGSGLGHMNIQNVLTSGPSPSGGMDVCLATKTGTLKLVTVKGTQVTGGLTADTLSAQSVNVTSSSSTSSWHISLSATSDLSLDSTDGAQVTFCNDFVPGVLNFTAQHRCVFFSEQGSLLPLPGSVVVATGKFDGLDGSCTPTVDEAIPVVALSSTANDPRVFGVVSAFEPDSSRRTFKVGSMGFTVPRQLHETSGRVIVNSGGEGGILVCGSNGPIENGDLIVSSPVAGAGMRQDDDVIHSYTIAKATCPCSFPRDSPRLALIGCVYMC